MKKNSHFKLFLGFGSIFFFFFGFINPAHAYLDPGTGSIILQGIIAAIAGIGITARLYWHRLLKLLNGRKDTNSDEK